MDAKMPVFSIEREKFLGVFWAFAEKNRAVFFMENQKAPAGPGRKGETIFAF
ncbi:MAG: hypothetical protein HFK04_01695 [Oscillospiraceae bacterium]|nr:hypothetical protein [Oscillospiraceae bacterium]